MKHIQTQPLLYQRIASTIEQQIKNEVLKIGDRLPSLRVICREYGVSQSTAIQAYHSLESRSLVEARPQSGFYVCQLPQRHFGAPACSKPPVAVSSENIDSLTEKVYNNLGSGKKLIPFSSAHPSTELLPVAKLNKAMVYAMRHLEDSGLGYEHPSGNERLRKQIARWSFAMEARLDYRHLLITSGCLNAIAHCLAAVTHPGDTIIMESPVSFGMLQVARSFGLRVLELPTDPVNGIDLDLLEKNLQKKKIAACLLISNFSNPLGCCMPDEHKKRAVKMMAKYGVPLIENDLNGDIYFGNQRPKSCKTYDEEGWVLWCGSVSKTLAPGYRVGWVEAGRFRQEVARAQLYRAISPGALTQETIAHFLETGRYESHLRKLRQQLYSNYLMFVKTIHQAFPASITKISRPQGGFVLWVELSSKLNTLELYERAIRQQISIAPGRLFSLRDQYHHCFRLNYGLPWTPGTENGLKTLGKLTHTLLHSAS